MKRQEKKTVVNKPPGIKPSKNGTRPEEAYSVQLNGNVSRAPPWPTPQLKNEKMFLLPKQLEPKDKIIVSCETMDQPGVLNIGLVTGINSPDYENLACQLKMSMPPQHEDNLQITIVQNGVPSVVFEDSAANFYEDTNFKMAFRMRDGGLMDILIGESYLSTVQLMHNTESIRFLTVNGDVNRVLELDFQFG